MKLCWITLNVKDFNKSLDFYTNILGIKLISQVNSPEIKMAMLGQEGQVKIELLENKGLEGPISSSISIGLEVTSLSMATKYLESKGITIVKGPIMPSPHIKFSFIQDPDGYTIQLVENLD